ncbi:MAG TPA: DUF2092 domain-containing protein [Verrucomicrobiae bacterium]|nr:DUF2092 domain-containing protein [Verrucomicrobiae bacterium]
MNIFTTRIGSTRQRTLPRLSSTIASCALLALLAGLGTPRAAAATKPTIDPRADELLKHMGDYLAQARQFSVDAEIWQDVTLPSGQRAQAGRTITLQVRRPDRFHAEVRSTRRNRGLFYDGKSITLLNRVENFYGTIPAPPTLDEALDVASDRFGITMPLEDLVVSDPYRNVIQKAVSGYDIGPVTVLGVPCEHLAFSLGAVDWQVWIEDGAKPVPRKIVFTYKDEEGSPEFTAIFSNWDFQTALPDFLFTFEPPAGASPIPVAEIKARNDAHTSEGK